MAKKNRNTSSSNTGNRDVINSNTDLGNKINELNESINNLIHNIENKTSRDDSRTENGFSSEEWKKKTKSEKTTDVLGEIQHFANGFSSGTKGIVDSTTNLIGKFGAIGKVIQGTIGAFIAVGQAVGSFITALASGKIQAYKGQAALNDITFEQFRQIKESNIKYQTESVKYHADIQAKQIETQGQILLNAVKLVSEQYVKTAEVTIGSIIEGINESAYKAAQYKIEAESQFEKNINIQKKIEGEQQRYETQRKLEFDIYNKLRKKDIDLLNIESEYKKEKEATDLYRWMQEHYIAQGGADKDKIVEELTKYKKNGEYGSNTENILDLMEKNTNKSYLGENATDKATGNAMHMIARDLGVFAMSWETSNELFNTARDLSWQKQLHPERLENTVAKASEELTRTIGASTQQLADKQADIDLQVKDAIVDAIRGERIEWLKLAEATEKWLDKFDKETNNLGKSLGYTNREQLDFFQKGILDIAENVAPKFGLSWEDAIKHQQGFIESTGRNRMFGEHDYKSSLALGEYLGDHGLASNYTSSMEIFNVGVADSVDMLDEALQDVNRIGLNGRKYTKTLVDNLRLAQKYNFKNGTKSLMDMAKWAENTRFNLGSLGGMLDKVHEGGLEGVITQAAQFQVLGGHAAMNANPIAMMYEAFADPEAYARRMQDMTKGYGRVDRITGETKFTGNELMMMQQLAKIQGRSAEEVMDEVRARNKKEVVAQQLNDDFNKEQLSYISNVAEYDKESGEFKVRVKNEHGGYDEKAVGDLTKNEFEKLIPERHNERMEDYMQTVVDRLGELTGLKESQQASVGRGLYDTRAEEYEKRKQRADDMFNKFADVYIQKAIEYSQKITSSYEDYTSAFAEGAKQTGSEIEQINSMAKGLEAVLGDTVSIIDNANKKITSALGIETDYDDYEKNPQKELTKAIDNFVLNFKEHYKEEAGYINGFKEKSTKPEDIMELIDKKLKEYQIDDIDKLNKFLSIKKEEMFGLKDGIVSTNNKPMYVGASNITPINDGIVRTHPNDVGIFAKEGGPIGNFLEDMYMLLKTIFNKLGGNDNRVHFDTLKIDGKMDLALNGQITDIISDIQNNPLFMRQFSRMLVEHMTKAMNGGRGLLNIGIGSV